MYRYPGVANSLYAVHVVYFTVYPSWTSPGKRDALNPAHDEHVYLNRNGQRKHAVQL